jgi:ribosomal protein S18 acetylase RimI-like enzyme
MASEFSIRTAVAADADALDALVNSAYRGESSKAGWTTEADLLDGQRVDADRIREMIQKPGSVILAGERDGALVACVHLEQTGEDCYLGMLTIQPVRQAQGLGRQMLASAERWATEHWSSRTMSMTVIAQRTELIAWYERRGYARTGTRKPFPYDDPRFGMPKRDDLVFEVLTKTLSPRVT